MRSSDHASTSGNNRRQFTSCAKPCQKFTANETKLVVSLRELLSHRLVLSANNSKKRKQEREVIVGRV